MKIILEREKCIGCGSCALICPKHFKMEEDGKSHLIDSETNPNTKNQELDLKNLDCIEDASSSCPVGIIKIKK